MYARYRDQRSSWSADFGPVIVRVQTDTGIEGLSVGFGGTATAPVIREHLSRLFGGEDPRHADALWEQMYRATPALHLMMTQANTLIAEWVRTSDRGTDRAVPVVEGAPDPVDGRIAASSAPGLGIREPNRP